MPARFVHLRAGQVRFFGSTSINLQDSGFRKYFQYMGRHLQLFACLSVCFILFTCVSAQIATPKEESKREADLIELKKLDKTIKLDIRYATADNFVGRAVYPEARAFLQRPAAESVAHVNRKLREKGYGLLVHDAYRPQGICAGPPVPAVRADPRSYRKR